MIQSRRCSALLVATTLVAAAASRPQAQTAAATAPTCMTLLTDAEVIKVLGAIPSTQKMTIKPGHTGCMWARQSVLSGVTSLAADFMDLEAIKALDKRAVESWGQTWPATPPRVYEWFVSQESEDKETRREAVPGLGQRATLFQNNGRLTIVIQRADGVATIKANVSRSELLAVARAFVAP